MKIDSLDSRRLLPAIETEDGPISEKLAWACAAFDRFVKTADARRLALSAPYSLPSIQALTDEELQEYYKEFGLATYYPDLPRASRDRMLYDEIRLFRKIGTKAAIEAMCQYIFGDNPISLEIIDNLAFDDNGVLTDESLLDMYDAIVNIENPELSAFNISRIFANLTKFNRDSQQLRYMTFRFNTDVRCPVVPIENDVACIFYDSQVMCEWYHTVSLFNAIDTVTGEETQFNAPPNVVEMDKGGEMFTSNKQLETIAPYNSHPTVDKGGTMFTSNKQLETIPGEGIEIIDLS
ncbi:MAG: hypothetical protein IJU23_14720 [Proteobacteria bacterium]|nr:hypothetical protein [Pseudomonadota bacterium]